MSKSVLLCQSNRLYGYLIIVFCFLLSSGCAGTHLYNKANHEMAKKADSSFKEVELSKSLIKERERLAELLSQEIEVVRHQTLSRRDAQLIAIIGNNKKSFNKFKETINERLLKLVGSDVSKFVEITNLIWAQEQKLANIVETYNFLPEASKHPLSCSDKPLPDVEDGMLQAIRNEYSIECKKHNDLKSELSKLFGKGEYGELANTIQNVKAEQKRMAKELKGRKKNYNVALKKYKTLKAKPQEISKVAKDLSKRLEALDGPFSVGTQALEILGLEDIKLIGQIEKLDEQRKSIGTIIDKISKGESISETDAASDTKVDIRIASTIDSLSQLYTKFNTYPLNALILQNERLRIEIDSLKRRVANAKEQLSLMERKRDAIKLEADSLAEAAKFLKFAEEDQCGENTLIANFKPKPKTGNETDKISDCQDYIGRSILHYANSWSIGRLAQDEIDYLLIGNQHKQALDDSEIALAHWENLLGVPITQLVALHGAGITSEEIAKFGLGIVNLAGLTAIAANVD